MVREHPTPRPPACACYDGAATLAVTPAATLGAMPLGAQQRSPVRSVQELKARHCGVLHKLLTVCLMLYADPSCAHDAGTARGKAPMTEVRAGLGAGRARRHVQQKHLIHITFALSYTMASHSDVLVNVSARECTNEGSNPVGLPVGGGGATGGNKRQQTTTNHNEPQRTTTHHNAPQRTTTHRAAGVVKPFLLHRGTGDTTAGVRVRYNVK